MLPLDLRAPQAHTEAILERMRPAAIENAEGMRITLADSVPVREGDALVITTSGTTGAPKGVVHTHETLRAAARLTGAATGTDADSHWLACLPLSHIGGFSVIPRALECGAGLTVHPDFNATRVERARARGATHVSLVPTALARIDPSGWQVILLGGSAIPAERPANCIATYGLTETGGGVVYDGRPLAGVEVRVTTAARIELRSPTLGAGYREISGDPAGEESWLTPLPLTEDGFLTTNDCGSFDEVAGLLTVQGRSDDLIISGGVNVWPEPVENLLRGHPAVSDCLVTGRADPEWGQLVVAVVVPTDAAAPPTLEELRGLVKEHLPAAHAPRLLELVGSLPRNAGGKLVRQRNTD